MWEDSSSIRTSVPQTERFHSEAQLSSLQIIGDELFRNLGLTIGAVAAVTLLLIQNLQTSFWVICCVLFTVIDLVGSMYWLGLTIEISSSMMILLCAGLAVDYSAHIGNEFMRLQGTRDGT
jgi:predicted RND superfamily exporter protein